jgi:hypothetical protein
LKVLKYIAVLLAGAGLGVMSLLLIGYENPKAPVTQQVLKIIEPDKQIAEVIPDHKDEELIDANKRLDKKIDRLADSLMSLKTRIDSLNVSKDSNLYDSEDTITAGFDSLLISGEDILVERDQLLSTELVRIENIYNDSLAAPTNVLIDSLKEKLNIVENDSPEYLKIEMWKSPLNYKGYKMSKSTLIVYGLLNELILHVYSKGDTIFVETNETSYQFEQTSDFKELCIIAER